MQVIELPIKHPELFEALGVAQPKVSHLAASWRLQRTLNNQFPAWLIDISSNSAAPTFFFCTAGSASVRAPRDGEDPSR